MNAERIAIAQDCLNAAHDGSLAFPHIIGKLQEAGFEGYAVDYRRNSQTYYLSDGDSIELAMPVATGSVSAALDGPVVAALVQWAQEGAPDYTYASFSEKAKAAGCAGYLVSFSGRRVVYYGRTAETHVEHFPN